MRYTDACAEITGIEIQASSLLCTLPQSGENEDELMDRETQLQLIAMGIPSPVTKESAGERLVACAKHLAGPLIRGRWVDA